MKHSTVLGADGFIGSRLVAELRRRGLRVTAVGRNASLPSDELGTVFYAIGVTADFRTRLLETMTAHVAPLLEVLRRSDVDKVVYLSSTRVYGGGTGTDEEAPLTVRPSLPDHLYNISKLAAESAGLCSGVQFVTARLSNIVGYDAASQNFILDILRAALVNRHISLRVSLDSEKDYLTVDDATRALLELGASAPTGIYNVAAGTNISNRTIVDAVAAITGCRVEVEVGAPVISYPVISVSRLRKLMKWTPASVIEHLPEIASAFQDGVATR